MKLHFSHLFLISASLISAQEVTAVETRKQTTHFQKVVKTAKERLGKKYADNQRINNCKVPLEKRGSKPRPDQCHRTKH